MIGSRQQDRKRVIKRVAPENYAGIARVGKSTKDLTKRLQPGEIAVIDHQDIDRVAAEGLVRSGVSAVLNRAPSCSGRYPNDGPKILVEAGVVLVDGFTVDVVEEIQDGSHIRIDSAIVEFSDRVVSGTRQTLETIDSDHQIARANLGDEFVKFVENTAGYFDDNKDLLSDDLPVPNVDIDFSDRHVLMVVRGHDYLEDLTLLMQSGYISEQKPILIGVDGGADALLENNLTPDLIIGDFDSVSEKTLNSGAELVVHAYKNGTAPGSERLDELGLGHHLFLASGTSEDIAMLMAYNLGATLIVAVGTHSSMVDFLDKGRAGMASTILTRMKVGPALVDAKGVSRLYHAEVRKRELVYLALAALIAILLISLASSSVQLIVQSIWSDLTG